MDKDTIDDLKQFIATLISQQVTSQIGGLREEMNEGFEKVHDEIRALDKKLTQKIDNLADYIGDALDTSNEETDNQLKKHEVRITRLETKTA